MKYTLVDPFAEEPGGTSAAEQAPVPSKRRRGPDAARKTSPQRLEANRKNAALSTGPKSPEGKAESRLNALKHGLHQQVPGAIRNGPFAENPEEVEALVTRVLCNLDPRDDLEFALAHSIATEILRSARLGRCESALLEKASALPLGRWQLLQEELEVARDLLSYLQDPLFEKPGAWRSKATDFIRTRTDRWAHSCVTAGSPPAILEKLVESTWAGNREAAVTWVEGRIQQLEIEADGLDRWDDGAGAEALMVVFTKLGTISTQSTRNLQRLLAEYRRLRERQLDHGVDDLDDGDEI